VFGLGSQTKVYATFWRKTLALGADPVVKLGVTKPGQSPCLSLASVMTANRAAKLHLWIPADTMPGTKLFPDQ
jgi:hypothetical protein